MSPATATCIRERVRPWLEAAAEWADEGMTWPRIVAGLDAGEFHLLANHTAAAIIQPHEQPDGQLVVHIALAGGDLAGVEELVSQAEEIARYNRAAKVTVMGREGWRRLAKKIGYRVDAVQYVKEL
jgi:hypothetical protein